MAKKDPFYKNAKVYGAKGQNKTSLDTGWEASLPVAMGGGDHFGGMTRSDSGRSKSAMRKRTVSRPPSRPPRRP